MTFPPGWKAQRFTMRKNAIKVGLLSAGILLIGSSAQAADNWNSSGNTGLLNGNQLKIPVQLPIELCGNAITVGGTASAWCEGGASATMHATSLNWISSGNTGLLNGNQVFLPIQIPINVCGNALGILGDSTAGCLGGSSAVMNPPSNHDQPMRHHKKKKKRHQEESLELTKLLPLEAVTGLLGSVTGGLLGGPAKANTLPAHDKRYGNGGGGNGGDRCDVNMTSIGNVGIANGIQAHAPIQIPIDISGNAIAVLGDATAWSVGGATANYC
ncbi:MAG TPA: hypothetical protein DGT23_35380 [Micromonosporaceae bacterium]|nr:hypothetical protein [Micromonosporaceae bacterium]